MADKEKELKEYKKLYEEAKRDNKETFMLGNREVLTKFAKYHIEHLEGRLKK